jgi:hypothetical protein
LAPRKGDLNCLLNFFWGVLGADFSVVVSKEEFGVLEGNLIRGRISSDSSLTWDLMLNVSGSVVN